MVLKVYRCNIEQFFGGIELYLCALATPPPLAPPPLLCI